jgi:hypothetical protein
MSTSPTFRFGKHVPKETADSNMGISEGKEFYRAQGSCSPFPTKLATRLSLVGYDIPLPQSDKIDLPC